MTVPTRSLSEINADAIQVLARELGVADTARFINQFTTGYGNYTEERKKLFDDLTLDEVASEIRHRKGKDG